MTVRTKAEKVSSDGARHDSRSAAATRFGRFGILVAGATVVAAAIVAIVAYFSPPDDSSETATVDSPVQTVSTPAQVSVARQAAVSLVTTPVPATAEQLQQETELVANELRTRFPNLAEALHVAAMMNAQLRRTAEAEQLWRKCIELSPSNEQYYVNLATVAMDRGNSELAAETLQRALDMFSSSPDVSHNLGVALTNLGRCEQAEQVIQKAIAEYPKTASHWVVLGQAQLKLGKAAEAEASLRKAIELGSPSKGVFFALSNACARQGKDEQAAKYRERFTELSASEPLNAQDRFQILSTAEARRIAVTVLCEAAAVHAWQGDSLEAERLLLRAIALDPGSMESCQALAELYFDANMPAEERVVRRRIAEIQPDNFANHLNLAKVCAQLGEPEAAEATLKLAIAIRPEAADAYATLAQFYLQAGKVKNARWFAQEAVRREPTAEGYVLLASTCGMLGDKAAAEQALAQARKLDSRPVSRRVTVKNYRFILLTYIVAVLAVGCARQDTDSTSAKQEGSPEIAAPRLEAAGADRARLEGTNTKPAAIEPAQLAIAERSEPERLTTAVASSIAVAPDRPANVTRSEPSVECPIRLLDVTQQSGIAFRHNHGGSGAAYIVEGVVGGLALFDYDGDGWIDIYFTNGAALKGTILETPPRNALYRNNGDWIFTDVTDKAGVGDQGFGLGVTAADYDNDGDQDLYVNNFGPNVLYRNNGDRTFTDVTVQAGVGNGNRVGAGACFFDMEGDGDLDLYVANYVDFTYENHVSIVVGNRRFHAGPRYYQAVADTLYRNNGDGTFTDVSGPSGIGSVAGPSMGMVCADFDDDGDTDVFVCNDESPNFFFQNDGRGKFVERGALAGLAYDFYGKANSSMGVDCGDYDNDGRLDLFVTDYQSEMPVLYHNLGHGLFEDATSAAGITSALFPHVNWGTGLVDFDNDADRDLFIACGHLDRIESVDDRTALRVANFLLMNTGNGKFIDVSSRCGNGLDVVESSRGAAFDDLDNDGDIDVVVLNSNAPPTILRNQSKTDHHWLQVRLQGTKSNWDGVGARVRVVAGDLVQVAEVHSGRGYQSHYAARLHFGLKQQGHVDRIEVRWPGGPVEQFTGVDADQLVVLKEGTGQPGK